MLAWCLHSPLWFEGFRFPLHSQTPVTRFHDLFIHLLNIKICVRLPVFPFVSDDSDDSVFCDDSDDFFFPWVSHASQDQTQPGLAFDGVSSLQVFDLST